MSSLGYIWAWQQLNIPDVCAGLRYFAQPPWWDGQGMPTSVEDRYPLAACDVIACSISYELDLPPLVRMLQSAGLAALAAERSPEDPFVIIGGPLTRANQRVLLPFADVVVAGDGEPGMRRLRELLSSGVVGRCSLTEGMTGTMGVSVSGTPAALCACSPASDLPIVSPVIAPASTLGDLCLVELARGCPNQCAFCLGHRGNGPVRFASTQTVMSSIPDYAPAIGLTGAAISYHPGLVEILHWAASTGRRAGLSSLRADHASKPLVEALARVGTNTLTVACDGPSQRIRDDIRKGITTDHILACAELAREARIHAMKLYVMIGFPGESLEDLREFVALTNELARRVSLSVSISPLVPKRSTGLEAAPFAGLTELKHRLQFLKSSLDSGIRISQVSARESWQQYVLTRCDESDAGRVVALSEAPEDFAVWRTLFPDFL
jgi:radical SAM superfamily enzyme YgiQ (UPF0313 family)